MAVPFAKIKETALMAKAIAKSGAVSASLDLLRKYYGGPELGSIALEYLLSSSTLPLGIILELFGPEGSGKTTVAVSILNDYFMRPGGEGALVDTEQKMNEALIRSLIDVDAEEDGRFKIYRAPTCEQAQGILSVLGKELNALTHGKRRDDNPHLLGIALDSFRVSSESTQESVLKAGHATKAYAVEANLWRQYLSTFVSLLQFAPMTLLVVNHQVDRESPYGAVADTGGGKALKYLETYRIQVKAIDKKSNNTEVYTNLALRSFKNSNGEAKQVIYPRIIYKSPDLPEGVTKVDWSVADAKLLTSTDIPRSKLSSEGICNVTPSSKEGLFNDTVNNLKMVPITEITQAIYADPEKLSALRKHIGIVENKNLDQLWDDGWYKGAKGDMSSLNED